MASMQGKGITAGGGYNYHLADQQIHIVNVFLNNFIKTVNIL
jgi:hypothetical protein